MGHPGPTFRSTYQTSTTSQRLAVQRVPSSTNHLRIVRMEAMPLPLTRSFRGKFQRAHQHIHRAPHAPPMLSRVNRLLHIRATALLLPTNQISRPWRRSRSGLSHLRVLYQRKFNSDCRILPRRTQPPPKGCQISVRRRCSYHRNRPCFRSRTDTLHLQRAHSSPPHNPAGSSRLRSCLCRQEKKS